GIRDLIVTGVQTCALPIYRGDQRHAGLLEEAGDVEVVTAQHALADGPEAARHVGPVVSVADRGVEPSQLVGVLAEGVRQPLQPRSEERRVGKGGRCAWERS